MGNLYRFGISLDKDLIDAFDEHIRGRNYQNRSEAIRDLIREELTRKQWNDGGSVAGAITMMYDHHKRELVTKLMELQHDYQPVIISTQHIHLDHHHCLEILAVRGESSRVQELADKLRAHIGVKHVSISMSATAEHLH